MHRTDILADGMPFKLAYCRNAPVYVKERRPFHSPCPGCPSSALILHNLFNSKSVDASGAITQLTQLSFGYIMRFQIGNGFLFCSLRVQRAGLVTMVKSAFVNSKQEVKANVCCMT